LVTYIQEEEHISGRHNTAKRRDVPIFKQVTTTRRCKDEHTKHKHKGVAYTGKRRETPCDKAIHWQEEGNRDIKDVSNPHPRRTQEFP
jgi:hypothetical protein